MISMSKEYTPHSHGTECKNNEKEDKRRRRELQALLNFFKVPQQPFMQGKDLGYGSTVLKQTWKIVLHPRLAYPPRASRKINLAPHSEDALLNTKRCFIPEQAIRFESFLHLLLQISELHNSLNNATSLPKTTITPKKHRLRCFQATCHHYWLHGYATSKPWARSISFLIQYRSRCREVDRRNNFNDTTTWQSGLSKRPSRNHLLRRWLRGVLPLTDSLTRSLSSVFYNSPTSLLHSADSQLQDSRAHEPERVCIFDYTE